MASNNPFLHPNTTTAMSPTPADFADPNHPHFPRNLSTQAPPTRPHQTKTIILWSVLGLITFGLIFTGAIFTGKKLGSRTSPITTTTTSILTTSVPYTTTSFFNTTTPVTKNYTLTTSVYTTNTSVVTVPTTQTVAVTSFQTVISTAVSVSVSTAMPSLSSPSKEGEKGGKDEEDPKCLPMGTWPSIEKCNKLCKPWDGKAEAKCLMRQGLWTCFPC